jgi:tRNA (adenine22-N1)-methyltransferase
MTLRLQTMKIDWADSHVQNTPIEIQHVFYNQSLTRPNVKLSHRLAHIKNMITKEYLHIWDCCCDHGLLGASLSEAHPESTIHFVDIVPALVSELDSKLKRFLSTTNWQTHCLDASNLPLTEYGERHLVIIAGVGGDLTSEIIETLYTAHPELNIDFLICPVHHMFALRRKAIHLGLGLIDEALVKENHRFYETLLLTTDKTDQSTISAVGTKIWEHEYSREYQQKLLNHYQRIQQGQSTSIRHIIDAYKNIY